MPRTSLQNDNLRQSRKRNLVLSGLKVFCEKGYDGATVDDIVKKAKCSHGLFYHYFDSKKAIFDEVLKQKNHRSQKDLTKRLQQEETYREKLRIITEQLFSDLKKDENSAYYFYFFVSQSFSRRESDLPPPKRSDMPDTPPHLILENFFKKGQEAGGIRTDYSPKECRRLYMSIIQGATLGYVIAPKEIQKNMRLPDVDFILDIFC